MSTNIPALEMQRLFATTEGLLNDSEIKSGSEMREQLRRIKELALELMRDN
jgi:hypothetical protein